MKKKKTFFKNLSWKEIRRRFKYRDKNKNFRKIYNKKKKKDRFESVYTYFAWERCFKFPYFCLFGRLYPKHKYRLYKYRRKYQHFYLTNDALFFLIKKRYNNVSKTSKELLRDPIKQRMVFSLKYNMQWILHLRNTKRKHLLKFKRRAALNPKLRLKFRWNNYYLDSLERNVSNTEISKFSNRVNIYPSIYQRKIIGKFKKVENINESLKMDWMFFRGLSYVKQPLYKYIRKFGKLGFFEYKKENFFFNLTYLNKLYFKILEWTQKKLFFLI